MEFIVVTQEWMSAHGIIPLPTMRKSKDGSKVLLHKDYFNMIAPKNEDDGLELDGAETYAHNSKELETLLSSDDWAGSGDQDGSAGYIQVAAVQNLMAATRAGIQEMDLTDGEALKVKGMYPEWEELIGQPLTAGTKLQYNGKLYKVIQAHTAQADWEPSGLPALYGLVTESHAGTLEDPVPYERNMVLEQGKYYTQYGVTYKCVTGSIVGYDADLTELLSLLEIVE